MWRLFWIWIWIWTWFRLDLDLDLYLDLDLDLDLGELSWQLGAGSRGKRAGSLAGGTEVGGRPSQALRY